MPKKTHRKGSVSGAFGTKLGRRKTSGGIQAAKIIRRIIKTKEKQRKEIYQRLTELRNHEGELSFRQELEYIKLNLIFFESSFFAEETMKTELKRIAKKFKIPPKDVKKIHNLLLNGTLEQVTKFELNIK